MLRNGLRCKFHFKKENNVIRGFDKKEKPQKDPSLPVGHTGTRRVQTKTERAQISGSPRARYLPPV